MPGPNETRLNLIDGVEYFTLRADDFRPVMRERDELRAEIERLQAKVAELEARCERFLAADHENSIKWLDMKAENNQLRAALRTYAVHRTRRANGKHGALQMACAQCFSKWDAVLLEQHAQDCLAQVSATGSDLHRDCRVEIERLRAALEWALNEGGWRLWYEAATPPPPGIVTGAPGEPARFEQSIA